MNLLASNRYSAPTLVIPVNLNNAQLWPNYGQKGLPKLVGFAPGAEHWPNRKAYKAEILHGGLEYPNDKVRLAKDCLKLHLKKVNFLQFFEPKFGIF